LAPTDKAGTARPDFTACAAIAASESPFQMYGIFLRLLAGDPDHHGSSTCHSLDWP
jgi:hypothetical protein